MRLSRDLRKMGDAEDLTAAGFIGAPGRFPAASPYLPGSAAADTGIDFIEYEGVDVVGVGQDRLDGEHHAGQLAPGGDPRDGARGSPGLADMRNST